MNTDKFIQGIYFGVQWAVLLSFIAAIIYKHYGLALYFLGCIGFNVIYFIMSGMYKDLKDK